MPHFTLDIDPINGPLLNAGIGISQARRDALLLAGKPLPEMFRARALLDTGASCVCVDPMVVKSLGLEPRGKTSVATPSTETGQNKIVDQYDVSLVILAGQGDPPFYLQTIPVIEAELFKKFGYHAILGRDVLASCTLFYNGGVQTYTFSY